VTGSLEGPRYCVACHLTDSGMAAYGAEYAAFRTAMSTEDYASLNYSVLTDHFGRNPGNQLNSPLWVHMVAGLGTGLFLFDDQGRPINPIDNDPNRKGSNAAPSSYYNPALVALNLDRVVDETGLALASSNHAMNGGVASTLRDGATDPTMAGPLGATLIQRLTDPATGIVLDSWVDANGNLGGDAGTNMVGP